MLPELSHGVWDDRIDYPLLFEFAASPWQHVCSNEDQLDRDQLTLTKSWLEISKLESDPLGKVVQGGIYYSAKQARRIQTLEARSKCK